jgi:hypothetical protein
MTRRSVLSALLVSFALAGAACAGEFDDDEDLPHRASLFQPRVNETPEHIEALARELSMRQHAAKFTQTDHGEIGRLDRKEQELQLRYRIAALRMERGFAKKHGSKRDVMDLEASIHKEKQKLAKMKARHRKEATAEKKADPFAMDEAPSLSPKFLKSQVPEDRS